LLPRRRPWDAQAGDLDAGGGLDAGDLDRRVVLLHRNLEVRQGLDEDGVEAHLIAGGDPGGFGGAAAADEDEMMTATLEMRAITTLTTRVSGLAWL